MPLWQIVVNEMSECGVSKVCEQKPDITSLSSDSLTAII